MVRIKMHDPLFHGIIICKAYNLSIAQSISRAHTREKSVHILKHSNSSWPFSVNLGFGVGTSSPLIWSSHLPCSSEYADSRRWIPLLKGHEARQQADGWLRISGQVVRKAEGLTTSSKFSLCQPAALGGEINFPVRWSCWKSICKSHTLEG